MYDTIFLALPEKVVIGGGAFGQTKTFLTPLEIQQSGRYPKANFNDDVFGGANLSRLLFGSISSTGNNVPSYDIQDVFFDNQAFQYLTSDQLKELSKIDGYISYDSTEYQLYRNLWSFFLKVNSVSNFISLVVDNLQFSSLPVHVTDAIEQQLKDQSKYFSSLRGYKTLNILTLVDELSDTNYLSLFADLANSFTLILNAEESSDLNNQIDKLSRKDFVNAALQRKYFIQEGTDGRKYFKLPLVKIITENSLNADGDVTAVQLAQSYDETNQNSYANSDVFRALIDNATEANIKTFYLLLLSL